MEVLWSGVAVSNTMRVYRPCRTYPSYTLICTSTDYDAWRTGFAPVTVEEVVKTLHTNAGNSRAVAEGILQDVYDVVKDGKVLDEIKGSMQFACITRADVSDRTLFHSISGPRRCWVAELQATIN